MNMFVSTAAIAAVPTTAPAMTQTSDRRALEAYASWLFMERRILCGELWPDMGADAERYDYYDNAGAGWHFRGDGDWRDLPQPSTRAAAVLDLVGVDWRQPKEDLGLNHADSGERPPLPPGWPHPEADLLKLGEEFERLLAIEQSLKMDVRRLSSDCDRIRGEKMGIDPNNHESCRAAVDSEKGWKEWNEIWEVAATETGYHKAWDAWNRASIKTAKIGKRIFKIKPTTKAGLLVRVRVIETHDEMFDVEPLEKLLEEIRGFARGAVA
ncbi:hypothetical protein V1279_003361 [Bradyrhizobium sp. AZCC 1610]|uniref:hypothetical protein n=1 Tax=Bradyrhizobium sp. AZCC 1610 TaxID=3117020 RepID=UPI002FF1ACF4